MLNRIDYTSAPSSLYSAGELDGTGLIKNVLTQRDLHCNNVLLTFGSQVREIKSFAVVLDTAQGLQTIPNDVVAICAGGFWPTPFFRSAGIQVEAKFGTA